MSKKSVFRERIKAESNLHKSEDAVITIKGVIEKVLDKTNQRRATSNKDFKTKKGDSFYLEEIKPYDFLNNPTMCRLIETQLLKKVNFWRSAHEKIESCNSDNLNEIAGFLYYDNDNYPTSFYNDEITSSDIVSNPPGTGIDAHYKYCSSGKRDIVEVNHYQTGSHIHHPGWKSEKLVIDRSGLQIKAIVSYGRRSSWSSAYVLKRDKKNIYKLEMIEYPDGLKETAEKDIKKYELDIRELRDITISCASNYYDPIFKSTLTDLSMIPNILRTEEILNKLETIKKQPGELKMDSKVIERRIQEDCKESESFRKTMIKMGLLHSGR